ncbi:SAM-dependent methyltransferase [Arthrobacter sp. MYb229]|uniref:class I SAM-dependent methyltransferase n=1 Tax=unclassified Arthrobacter TaxID=235627 RepID=UPI000CFCAF7A|nr:MULTISPECIES: class I SAM-dependent methyltransferase [unclassified Arthrobacter]PRA04577.1 SAM-dependent methyltransferase [Arthrobacter sp. MYb229]PRB51511.1 SAM-dependent methyltransferase [Arthrobacter sp. MYb216]
MELPNVEVKSAAAAYDAIADGYTAENDSSLLNEYYNRPAIRALLGEVKGHHVLDAGCGSGPNIADLLGLGATVIGIDGSAAMLDIARDRLGPGVDLRVADLAAPLPFEDNTFDDVLCSLSLHYLEDWQDTLAQMKRVLKPGGRLILSVEHPFATWLGQREAGVKTNYFETRSRTENWQMNGQETELTFWDRSLSAMLASFLAAGFRLTHLEEPAPSPEAVETFPDFFNGRQDPRFLAFLFIVLEA